MFNSVALPCMDAAQGCPKRVLRAGEKGFCPIWTGPGSAGDEGIVIQETNMHTGDVRMVQGCFFQVMPQLMRHVIMASNRPAASLDAMRVEMTNRVEQSVVRTLNAMVAVTDEPDELADESQAPRLPVTEAKQSSG